ncbi:MAG: phage portal protein [Christensenellales bacterium]
MRSFKAKSFSPNADINYANNVLRQRCRMLYMSTPTAAAAANTTRTKGVGSGLHCKPSIRYRDLGLTEEAACEWQRKTEAEFRLWAESKECDALGINNFYELEQLAWLSWVVSGDVFAVLKHVEATPYMPYTLRIHLIEADRVSTPFPQTGFSPYITDGKAENGNRIFDGVEVDKTGKVVAYYICSTYVNQFQYEKPEWTRVEAIGEKTGFPNIVQVFNAERPDQYRGVSYLAPIVEILLQQRRYTEAELTAAIIQSSFTAWIKHSSPNVTDNPLMGEDVSSEPTKSDKAMEIGPGNIISLDENDDVVFGNPNIPVAGFEAFVKTLNKMAGAALELPYDVLIKEFNSSYSASKGALEEAAETIRMKRSWFVSDFCQPIYEVWLAEAVASGRISAPGFFRDPAIRKAWSTARWDGPAQTHLDPVKEATANEMLVKNGWKTNEQIAREYYGSDWSENVDVILREKARFEITQGGVGNAEDITEE